MRNKEKRFARYRRHQRHHRRRRLVFHFTRELYRFVFDSSGTVAAAPTPATGENKMDRNVRVYASTMRAVREPDFAFKHVRRTFEVTTARPSAQTEEYTKTDVSYGRRKERHVNKPVTRFNEHGKHVFRRN